MNRIDPDRLIQLRAARGLSRQRLAKSSHVSARQIARLEVAEEPVDVRATTMSRLASTLDVEPAVLAAETPVPTDLGVADVQPVNVLPDILVELRKRKGWSRRQLAEAARVSPQMIERTERQPGPVNVRARTSERPGVFTPGSGALTRREQIPSRAEFVHGRGNACMVPARAV